MEEQSYAKHVRVPPPGFLLLGALSLLAFIGSLINLYRRIASPGHQGRLAAELIVLITVAMILQSIFSRNFALKAQDRVIRSEENLRHFVLTGKLLDQRLSIKQIIGLRFASDAEFVELARRAADEGMSMDEIKKSVKSWRADHDRL